MQVERAASKGIAQLSTQPDPTPQWKEEVNRRLAAHKNRKEQAPAQETEPAASGAGDSRAAQAAARVAARYAKARSYSQMQAEEARVAVRAAEIATRVALKAQQAAETALAGLHAATQEPPSRRPAVVRPIAPPLRSPEPEAPATPVPAPFHAAPDDGPVLSKVPEAKPDAAPPEAPLTPPVFDIRWDPDMPVRPPERSPLPRRVQEEFELSVEDWWSPAEDSENLRSSPIEVGDDAPAQANLIQFPRELVATRRLRPRLAEASVSVTTDADPQLSIFEVDPATVSTEAAMPDSEHGAVESTWSGMRLDTQPADIPASRPETAQAPARLPVAPLGLRLMGAVVDCSLILIGFVGIGFLVAHSLPHPPAAKVAELLGGVALALIGWAFYAFFFALPACTPGMKYAGIGLCTFDGSIPTREQLRRRLTAMLVSVLPLGLGLVWSLFDEDHLSWHDRFSQTYLRKL